MKNLASRVSKCCNAPIMRLTGKEFPDGRTFYITTSWDACTNPKCPSPEWPDTFAYKCENCGDGTDWIVETELGEYCRECANETRE